MGLDDVPGSCGGPCMLCMLGCKTAYAVRAVLFCRAEGKALAKRSGDQDTAPPRVLCVLCCAVLQGRG